MRVIVSLECQRHGAPQHGVVRDDPDCVSALEIGEYWAAPCKLVPQNQGASRATAPVSPPPARAMDCTVKVSHLWPCRTAGQACMCWPRGSCCHQTGAPCAWHSCGTPCPLTWAGQLCPAAKGAVDSRQAPLDPAGRLNPRTQDSNTGAPSATPMPAAQWHCSAGGSGQAQCRHLVAQVISASWHVISKRLQLDHISRDAAALICRKKESIQSWAWVEDT